MTWAISSPSDVDAVRRLQPTPKGAIAKLKRWPNQVLTAAIAAENAAADCRPMFIAMLQGELDRRQQAPPPGENNMTQTMGTHQYIPLSQLRPSPLNHRKHFDKGKLEELAESIRIQGVIQPIVARPLNGGDSFEVVAGERRFRAAKAADLVDIPAIVRDLTDAQTIELQVVENGQRENVHPLEEAEGYEALMACTKTDGQKYMVEDIAAKVGKSKAYVYARLKLTALCKEAREAFYSEKLDASKALLLARIPVAELQKKALGEITKLDYDGRPYMNYRDAAQYVQREFMLQLERAPFPTGDADLVKAAGACSACPKRTGNQPELFGDVKSADVCTDPKCFESKRDAHVIRLAAAAKKSGQEVITGKEARKIAPHGTHNMKGYIALDEKCWDDPKNRTYRQLLGKDAPQPTLIEKSDSGQLIDAVRTQDVAALLKTKVPKVARSEDDGGSEKWRADQRKREKKERLERSIRIAIHAQVRDKVAAAGLSLEDVRVVASSYWERLWYDAKKPIAPLWIPDEPGKKISQSIRIGMVDELIPKMSGGDLIKLLLDCSLGHDLMGHGNGDDNLAAVAKRHGVDAAGIRKELTDAAKEKDADKKKRKAKK